MGKCLKDVKWIASHLGTPAKFTRDERCIVKGVERMREGPGEGT